MATQVSSGRCQRPPDRPDSQYSLVAGLYVATLLAPVAILMVSSTISDAAVLYVGFLGAVASIALVAGWLVSRTAGLAVALGRHDASWLLVIVPFVWFIGAFVVTTVIGIEPAGISVLLAMLATVGGLFLGLILLTMSRNRHATTALESTSELARWEARWPRRWRRVATGGAIIAGVAGLTGLIAQLAFGVEWAGNLYLLLAVWAPFASLANPRTFRATEAGLAIERPLQRQFRPWTAYEAYKLTDEELIIRPSAWWRPALRCDRADIEDSEAAIAALNRHCPEIQSDR